MEKGYKVEYAWWKYPADKLETPKKYFSNYDDARDFMDYILCQRHYYNARIIELG